MSPRGSVGALVTWAAALSACGTTGAPPPTVAAVLSPLPETRVVDLRPQFRREFCRALRVDPRFAKSSCESWLQKLADESESRLTDLPSSRSRHEILLVSGLLAECFTDSVNIFSDSIARMRSMGYEVSTIPVRGRASSIVNAEIIKDFVADRSRDAPARSIILVAYSKGVADTLTALVNYPEFSRSVAAVVSIAGAVNGSPLAESLATTYAAVAEHFPFVNCPVVEKGALRSLEPRRRLAFVATHPLPAEIAYFSLVGLPDSDRVSVALKPFYRKLSHVDPGNDGQLIYYDAVVPRSFLLGYMNADHWAMALPIETDSAVLGRTLANRNVFPRASMLEAALHLVESELERRGR